MSYEDAELVRLLGKSLDEDAPPAPPPDRIAALRGRADAARAQRMAAPTATVPPPWPPPRRSAGQPGRSQPGRNRTPRWLAVAAVVIAVASGFGAALVLERGDDRVAGVVEYDGPMTGPDDEPADADLTVTATAIGRVVDLRTEVLPVLPTGELYEVWFVATDDSPATPHRISAGTFHPDPDGRSDVRFTAAVNPRCSPSSRSQPSRATAVRWPPDRSSCAPRFPASRRRRNGYPFVTQSP